MVTNECIVTVKEAMELARNEYRKYQSWVESGKKENKGGRKKAIRTEMVPDWLNKEEVTNTTGAREEDSSYF